jgi:hypothetical protein
MLVFYISIFGGGWGSGRDMTCVGRLRLWTRSPRRQGSAPRQVRRPRATSSLWACWAAEGGRVRACTLSLHLYGLANRPCSGLRLVARRGGGRLGDRRNRQSIGVEGDRGRQACSAPGLPEWELVVANAKFPDPYVKEMQWRSLDGCKGFQPEDVALLCHIYPKYRAVCLLPGDDNDLRILFVAARER